MRMKKKIVKRILSLMLCAILVFGCWPIEAQAAEGEPSTPVREMNLFYGNGTPIYIDAGTSSGKTVVYYYNGSEKVYLNNNGAAGEDLSGCTVYGGKWQDLMTGSTSVTMYGGTVAGIVGGGIQSRQNGDFQVAIHGGTVGDVILSGVATDGNQTGDCMFTMTGGRVSGIVRTIGQDNLTGDVSITMTGGSVRTIMVMPDGSNLKIIGNANVIVAGDAVVENKVIFQTNSGGHSYVQGTVTGIVSSGTVTSLYGDPLAQFNKVIYNNNGTWVTKGNPEIPEGITLKIDVGESFKVEKDTTLTNKGTMVNNGTVTINGALDNQGTIDNQGTFIRNAAYIVTGNSGTPAVWADGQSLTPITEYVDGKLYLYKATGKLKAALNGSEYYGYQATGSSTELTKDYVAPKSITCTEETLKANNTYNLEVILSCGNTTLPCTMTYKIEDAGTTRAELNGSSLIVKGAGQVKLYVTASDGYTEYKETLTFAVEHTPVTGLSSSLPSITYTNVGMTLPTAVPEDASYKEIEWSVSGCDASISNGVLVAKKTGTMTLIGIVKHGLGYDKDYTVTKEIQVQVLDSIDLSAASVTVARKDDKHVIVTYAPFGTTYSEVSGQREYGIDEIISISSSGISTTNAITVNSGSPTIQLNNVVASTANQDDASPFSILGGDVKLILAGENSLAAGKRMAALDVASNAIVTISGEGSLKATGGSSAAGIGGSYNRNTMGTVIINGGTIDAVGGDTGAGIGGASKKNAGTIIINGGLVYAKGSSTSAGIGAGGNASAGEIIINGGIVNAENDTSRWRGAAIGGGYGGSGGKITINGGTITAKANTGYSDGAAIGGGYNGDSGTIIITGGNIKAVAGLDVAPIGAGEYGTSSAITDGQGNIVSLQEFTLEGMAEQTQITSMAGDGVTDYGMNDVYTLDNNKLYFYLKEGSKVTSITTGETEYCCTKDGKTWYATHNWEDAVCSRCGEICYHEGQSGTCGICGKTLHTHRWEYSVSTDGTRIVATCVTDGCEYTNGIGGSVTIVAPADLIYDGTEKEATLTFENWQLGEEAKPTVSYNDTDRFTVTNKDIVATITLDGKSASVIYQVQAASISGATVTASDVIYTGSEQTPDVSVVMNGKTLAKDTDYTVSYSNNTNAGTATITVTGAGNYEGTANGSFTIGSANLESAVVTLDQDRFVYDGMAHKPNVTVTFGGVTLQEGVDYKVTYLQAMAIEGGKPTKWFGTTSVDCVSADDNYYVVVEGLGNYYTENNVTLYAPFVIEKATVTEPTIAGKPYTGSAQIADVTDTDRYTVVTNDGGIAAGSYKVVLALTDMENYQWASDTTGASATVELTFVITAAENCWTTQPAITGWIYGQEAEEPVAAAEFGTVQVVYTGTANDGSDYRSEAEPTKAGSYTATFTVAATADYSGLSASLDFTIAKADYDMSGAKWNYTGAFKYDGKEHKVEVVGLPSGVTVDTYTGNTATVVGDYTAKVTLTYDANNYNVPSVADLNWKVENNWTPTEYAVNGNGWMNQEFVITAADGYKISLTDTADGVWADAISYSVETDNGSITFYLKNVADGTISLAETVSCKIDKTAPTGSVEFVERTGWQEFVNNITFGLFYKDEVTVKITSTDNLSGVAKIEYCASDVALTLEDVKAINDWTAYNGEFGVTLEDAKKFVYYVRITDNAGNVTYLSTDGAEYDITAPVISGVENGKAYYTTQKVTVTDKNLDTVTLNGNAVTDMITLDGNKDVTYTIVATDKAGNSTTITVTMKPIRELAKATENLTNDNVTSDDADALNELIAKLDELIADPDTSDDGERETLEQHKVIAEGLLETIDETEAELARIDEEVGGYNETTVNSDDTAALEQLANDIKELIDGDNLTDAERTSLTEDAGKVADMQKTVADTTAENKRISDAVDDYDLATVTSEDKEDLEQLLDEIEEQLGSTNLTEEEITELNGDKKAVEDLLAKIEGTDELIDQLTEDVDGYEEETIKVTDEDALKQIIEDIDALLETENLTEAERQALEEAKEKAEALLDVIEEIKENVADAEDLIEALLDPADPIQPDDKDVIDAYEEAQEAYDDLTDYEKSLVDEALKEKLEDVAEALTAYKILEGVGSNWTKNSGKTLTFKSNGYHEKLDRIEVDGKIVDIEYYEVKAGSTIVTLKADFLQTLSVGQHTFKMVYTDGECHCLFGVKAAPVEQQPEQPATNAPMTGDTSHLWLWAALAGISAMGVMSLGWAERKRKAANKR